MNSNKKKKITNEIIETINDNDISKQELHKIKLEPMGDDDIRTYYPNSRILTYPQLKTYNSIEELLPNDKSHVFLLYLSQPNSGHWTLVSRNNNVIEFFCSYGSSPSAPLKWLNSDERNRLGESIPYLDLLLNKTKIKVIYNPIDYQDKINLKISTCGRYDCFRLMTILKYNLTLAQFYQLMKTVKDKTGLTYDEIVSDYINKL